MVVKGQVTELGGLDLNPHSATYCLWDFGWSGWTCQSLKFFICEIRVLTEPAFQGCVRIIVNHPRPKLSILLGTWQALSYYMWRISPPAARGHNPASWFPVYCTDHLTQPPSIDMEPQRWPLQSSVQNPGLRSPFQSFSTPSGTSPQSIFCMRVP